jgi:hypothetical protein
MAIQVKHTKVSTVPDSADTSLVRPSDWNDSHTLTGFGTAAALDAGSANGVATLDATGKVPASQIPLQGDLNYQGTWNASTNTPTLTSSTGTKGYYYVVDVAGSTNLNGITDWQIGDWAIFNGSVWQKVDNTDAVTSVNGQVGTVVLTQTDISGTVPTSRTITAGTGLTGGGDLSANRTIALANTAVTAGTYGSDSRSITQIVDAQGRLTSVIDQPIAIANTQVSGLGTMSTQNANAVAVTGGTINGTTIGATTATTGAFTTVTASTSLTSPILKASNSAGGALQNSGGTPQIQWGAGGGNNVTIDVSANLNGTNAQIDISPTGTGHVHINPTGTGSIEMNPTSAGVMNNMVIGGTTPLAGSFTNLSVTGTTKFDGSEGTSGQVLTSAGTGNTPTWTTPTTGTVTSVSGTAPVSVATGTTTPVISLATAYGDTQNPYASKTANYFLAAPNGSSGAPTFRAVVAADIPTLNQNTTGNAGTVTNGVYTTGSYADPTWLTSLAGSKITGTIDGGTF